MAREKCLAVRIFDKVIISSDNPYFDELFNCKQVEFVQRTELLAGDNAITEMAIDFFRYFPSCETILWINIEILLQLIEDIKLWDTFT